MKSTKKVLAAMGLAASFLLMAGSAKAGVDIASLKKLAANDEERKLCTEIELCKTLHGELGKVSLADQLAVIALFIPQTADAASAMENDRPDLSLAAPGAAVSSPASGRTVTVGADGRPVVPGGAGVFENAMLRLASKVRAEELSSEAESGAISLDDIQRSQSVNRFVKFEEGGYEVQVSGCTENCLSVDNGQTESVVEQTNPNHVPVSENTFTGLQRELSLTSDGQVRRDLISEFNRVNRPKESENPNATPIRPVTPEIQAAVQQLIAHPQGGVKGGQVDPISMKDAQTTQSPDAATKPVVSAQQKQTMLNQAKFGSGFAAPVSSRNGGGGMPTEVGGLVGSPTFTNSGTPASTGCGAGRVCR